MNKSGVGLVALDFADMSGGINNSLPQHAIGDNQVYDSANALIERRGVTKPPGYVGVLDSLMYGAPCTGYFIYRLSDGTDVHIVCLNDGIVYSVDVTTGVSTPIMTMGGSGQVVGCQLLNKFFLSNGTGVVKIESASVGYKVAIAAPTGASAAKLAGGSLTGGAYKVYAGYARSVAGVNVLYGNVQSLGTVTLSAGDLSVRVTFPNSSDAQVNNKVVWMTDAGGTVVYFYYETGNNTTTTVDVTSATTRNASIDMSIFATPFYEPPAFVGIFGFDNRIWGWTENDNILYYSLKAGTVYDLEKFVTPSLATGNRIICPANIISVFSVSDHLYINTALGLWCLPYGDVSSKLQKIGDTLYFKYPRSVVEYNSLAWGVTNDGFRFFDGAKFSSDLSKDVRKYFDEMRQNATSTFLPCGAVYRRAEKRTEFHLCYKDPDTNGYNGHLVLNMDYWNNPQGAIYPWETWTVGFSQMATDANNVFYGMQTTTSHAQLCRENGDAKSDLYVLDNNDTFQSTAQIRKLYIKSKLRIPDLSGMCRYDKHSLLATFKGSFTVTITMPDKNNVSYATTIPVSLADQPILDADGITFPFVLPVEYPVSPITKTAMATWSKMMFVEIRQEVLDDIFQLYEYTIYGATERSVMT